MNETRIRASLLIIQREAASIQRQLQKQPRPKIIVEAAPAVVEAITAIAADSGNPIQAAEFYLRLRTALPGLSRRQAAALLQQQGWIKHRQAAGVFWYAPASTLP